MQTIPPHHFDALSEPLQDLLQTQSLDILCTSTGQALADSIDTSARKRQSTA